MPVPEILALILALVGFLRRAQGGALTEEQVVQLQAASGAQWGRAVDAWAAARGPADGNE